MAAGLLVTMLALGAIGVYLALPGPRPGRGYAALLVLMGAGAALLAGVMQAAAGRDERIWFAAISILALWGAIRVVTHRRPVYSALYFILVVVATTSLLVLAQAQFLAVALLIIYAGAILVTYVFVIMLAQQSAGAEARYDRQARDPLLGALAGFALLAVIAGQALSGRPVGGSTLSDAAGDIGTVTLTGTHLLGPYAVGVEIAGVLLLAAMVGAIALARRRPSVPDVGGAGSEPAC
jgi:NADH-quinone oxidoreductase subunit J